MKCYLRQGLRLLASAIVYSAQGIAQEIPNFVRQKTRAFKNVALLLVKTLIHDQWINQSINRSVNQSAN